MAAMGELERAITERLSERDLRFTDGRRSIVSGLRAADGPVTLPELLDLVPDLAQSSAYRNLSLLEDAGVVRRLVHTTDHARYELAEELTEHHHHLICERCGTVRDVTFDDAVEHTIDEALGRLAAREGFVARHHSVDVYGDCADCSA